MIRSSQNVDHCWLIAPIYIWLPISMLPSYAGRADFASLWHIAGPARCSAAAKPIPQIPRLYRPKICPNWSVSRNRKPAAPGETSPLAGYMMRRAPILKGAHIAHASPVARGTQPPNHLEEKGRRGRGDAAYLRLKVDPSRTGVYIPL